MDNKNQKLFIAQFIATIVLLLFIVEPLLITR